MTKQEYEATIAELRERHEAFVRKIREQAGDERFTDAYSINRIIALCDAELSGELRDAERWKAARRHLLPEFIQCSERLRVLEEMPEVVDEKVDAAIDAAREKE